MTELATKSLTAGAIRTVLAEMLRRELRAILAEQAAPLRPTNKEIDARIEEFQSEINRLRRDARRGDFHAVEHAVRDAARAKVVSLPETLEPDLGRKAMDLVREVRNNQVQIENGEEPTSVLAPLVATFSAAPVTEFVKGAVTVTQVIERTHKLYASSSMYATIEATGELVREFFGDIDFDLFTYERLLDWFTWMLRLPKLHGKKHGKNRYTDKGKAVSKQGEIEEADLKDELATEEVRATEGLSLQEKRTRLSSVLTPRTTVATARKHRNNFARMFRAAQSLGVKSDLKIPSYKDIDICVASLAQTGDELYVRVTQPKTRTPWSEEHLTRLLTSPIYMGCASPHRRWKPGPLIIRDATYWVPLLVMLIGSRVEELLRLKRGSLQRRNKVDCLAIGFGADEQVKTPDSVRFVPIPQVLLDLGFADWIRGLPSDANALLFPEAAERSSKGKISDAFGKHLRLVFSRLGVADFDEDFYALRKTLLSNLSDAEVPDNQRKAIAGHRQQDIINRHYTAHRTKKIKASLDRIDHGLTVEFSAEHGFPVIRGCDLAEDSERRARRSRSGRGHRGARGGDRGGPARGRDRRSRLQGGWSGRSRGNGATRRGGRLQQVDRLCDGAAAAQRDGWSGNRTLGCLVGAGPGG